MTFERHKVNKRVLQDLKKRSSFGTIFYILLAVIIVLSDNYYERHRIFSMFFFLSMLGICSFRLIHLAVSRNMSKRYETININIFFISVIVSALIWGITFSLILLQQGEYTTQMFTTVLICGLCAGGVVAFTPNRWLSIYFNISMLMPAAVSLFVHGLHINLAIMIILFSLYLVIITYRGNREYWNALENEYLLELKSNELAHLSNTDVLTGLYNRRYFNQALDLEWKRSGRNKAILSIIIFDIDNFKDINDTFGHQAGDEYLTKTAAILNAVFKRDYDIVARYGGEEFIVLLPGINAEQARQLAEQVRKNIEFLILHHQGNKLATTISGGIMCCVADFNITPDYIVACADKALYKAKQTGRNMVVVFTPAPGNHDA
ncbi:MAG: GGDEF domain-containing protein [Smithella sp.]|jgi:diguanylate cyclase (GGDEF)-like protein